jgi:hypothetical protein
MMAGKEVSGSKRHLRIFLCSISRALLLRGLASYAIYFGRSLGRRLKSFFNKGGLASTLNHIVTFVETDIFDLQWPFGALRIFGFASDGCIFDRQYDYLARSEAGPYLRPNKCLLYLQSMCGNNRVATVMAPPHIQRSDDDAKIGPNRPRSQERLCSPSNIHDLHNHITLPLHDRLSRPPVHNYFSLSILLGYIILYSLFCRPFPPRSCATECLAPLPDSAGQCRVEAKWSFQRWLLGWND